MICNGTSTASASWCTMQGTPHAPHDENGEAVDLLDSVGVERNVIRHHTEIPRPASLPSFTDAMQGMLASIQRAQQAVRDQTLSGVSLDTGTVARENVAHNPHAVAQIAGLAPLGGGLIGHSDFSRANSVGGISLHLPEQSGTHSGFTPATRPDERDEEKDCSDPREGHVNAHSTEAEIVLQSEVFHVLDRVDAANGGGDESDDLAPTRREQLILDAVDGLLYRLGIDEFSEAQRWDLVLTVRRH